MKCIDCKIEMEKVERVIDGGCEDGRVTQEVYVLYRCPVCCVEIEEGDEDYEWDTE